MDNWVLGDQGSDSSIEEDQVSACESQTLTRIRTNKGGGLVLTC